MEVKFNINHNVKVKLTEYGINVLKERRKELNEYGFSRGGKGFGEVVIITDEDGYATFQLWDLMNTFGDAMNMGIKVPFETNIIICFPNT